MKTPIKFLAIAIIAIASTTQLSAQNRKGPQGNRPPRGERAEKMEQLTPEEAAKKATERMTKTLQLTDKQSKELYEVNLKYIKLREEKKANKSKELKAQKEDRESAKKEFEQSKAKKEKEINNILTPSQQEALASFNKMREKREAGKGEKGEKHRRPEGPRKK